MKFSSKVDVLENVGTVPGPFGKIIPKWEVSIRGYACAVQRANGTETRTDAGTIEVVDYIIFAPVNPPWTGASRLRFQGRDLQIIDVDQDVVDRGHHSETSARKVGASG